MSDSLERVRDAAERARQLEADLEVARSDLYGAMAAARDEGQSLAALARTLGSRGSA